MVVDELGVGMPPVPPVPQAGDKVGMWDGIIKGFIYALVLLLPLIFAGWTFEPLEFSKQMLLYVLVSGAAIAWLLKLLIFRQVSFVKTPLDLPIGIFLVVYLLASIFSVDRVASFLGFYGSFSGNFFELLFLTILFYLIVNNFTDTKSLKKLFGFFQFSLFIVLLYIILQFFGLHIIPLEFAKANGFNTVGGILMISLFSAFTIVLSLVETESSCAFDGQFRVRLGCLAAGTHIVSGLAGRFFKDFFHARDHRSAGIIDSDNRFSRFPAGIWRDFASKSFQF